MIITRSRELTFRLADYEQIKTSATIVADTKEIELPDGVTLDDHLDSMLDDLLALDVVRADAMSSAQDHETFVHAWKEETVK